MIGRPGGPGGNGNDFGLDTHVRSQTLYRRKRMKKPMEAYCNPSSVKIILAVVDWGL